MVIDLYGTPAWSASKDWSYSIESFRVALELEDGGDYVIEERIAFSYHGGTYSQGFRRIPIAGLDSIADLEVTSPDAAVGSVEVTEGRRLKGLLKRPCPRSAI